MADNPIYDENNVCLYDDLGNKVGVILADGTYRLAGTNIITNEDGTKVVTTTTDGSKERLDTSSIPHIYDQPVNVYTGYGTATNKATYTVPTGKILYIVTMFVTADVDEGGKITLEWQYATTGYASTSVYKDSDSNFQLNAPAGIPFGPYAAGGQIRCRRVNGDSGKDWAAGFVGYLENV